MATLTISGNNASYKLTLSGMSTSTRYHVFVADLSSSGTVTGYKCVRSSLGTSSTWTHSGTSSSPYSNYGRSVYVYTSTAATSHSVGSTYTYDQMRSGCTFMDSDTIPAGSTSYTTHPIYFRTGTGVSSYTMEYANSTSTGNSDDITGRNSSTTLYVRDSTNAKLTHISYESGYTTPIYFVEYTSSSFSTVKKTFTEGDLNVYSNGTRYIKLFATKQITYVNVRYYKNGGTWSSGSDPYTDTIESGSYSGTATPSGRLSRTNYRLLGWSTSSSATSATYGTNEAIGPLGTDLTLYAVWQELPYITLDAGEGRFGTDRYAYFHIDYGDYVYFNRYTPTRDGYTLIGWSATQGATSPTYGPSDAVGPLYGSSYKYYAVWQKATAKITLNGNGGLWDASTGIITVTLDVGDTLLFSKYSSLTRAGYIHLGWSTSPTATTAAWGVNGSVTVGATDATYYAVWQKKSIALFYWNNETWDAANIKKGEPVSNLTASRWNALLAKIQELAECEGGSYSYSGVISGATIYATTFNNARTAISNRTGYGTLPAAQEKDNEILASLFEGNGSLKSALNAAITHYNNS